MVLGVSPKVSVIGSQCEVCNGELCTDGWQRSDECEVCNGELFTDVWRRSDECEVCNGELCTDVLAAR